MPHIRQSRPNYGRVFQVKVLKTMQVVPSSLGSGHFIWARQFGVHSSVDGCALRATRVDLGMVGPPEKSEVEGSPPGGFHPYEYSL